MTVSQVGESSLGRSSHAQTVRASCTTRYTSSRLLWQSQEQGYGKLAEDEREW